MRGSLTLHLGYTLSRCLIKNSQPLTEYDCWTRNASQKFSQSQIRHHGGFHKPNALSSKDNSSDRLMGTLCHTAWSPWHVAYTVVMQQTGAERLHLERRWWWTRACWVTLSWFSQWIHQLTRTMPKEDMNDSDGFLKDAASPAPALYPEGYSSPDNQSHLCRGLITLLTERETEGEREGRG